MDAESRVLPARPSNRAAEAGAEVLSTASADDLRTSAFRNPDGTIGLFGFNGARRPHRRVALDDDEQVRLHLEPRSLFTARELPPPPPEPQEGDVLLTGDGGMLEAVVPTRLADTRPASRRSTAPTPAPGS